MTYLSVVGDLIPDFIVKLIQLLGKTIYTNRWHVLRDLLFTSPIASHKFLKLIQPLGKSIYANRWKIKKNMPSNLSFAISGN